MSQNIPKHGLRNCFIAAGLTLFLSGCASAQTFLQESGEAHKRSEQIEWVNEPSANATNWTTYMDLEGR